MTRPALLLAMLAWSAAAAGQTAITGGGSSGGSVDSAAPCPAGTTYVRDMGQCAVTLGIPDDVRPVFRRPDGDRNGCPAYPTQPHRYTAADIDRMRDAIALFQFKRPSGAMLVDPKLASQVEDRLRTYMLNGTTAEELEKQ